MSLVDIEDGPLSLYPTHFKNQYKVCLVMSVQAVAPLVIAHFLP